jgi:hypothetical protein
VLNWNGRDLLLSGYNSSHFHAVTPIFRS